MKDKLEEILTIYEENHLDFYYMHNKVELDNYKNKLIEKIGLNSKEDLFYIIKRILKYMLGNLDTHTNIRYGKNKSSGLEFEILNNDLYTIRTSDEFKDYNYKKLIAINNIDINTIKKEIEKITRYSTKEELEGEIELCINCNQLDRLPLFRNCSTLTYTFEDGTNLNYDTTKDYSIKYKIGDNCSYRIEGNNIIFTYLSCMEPQPGYMKEVVEKLKQEININKIDYFTIDLRYNRGGNSAIINPLLDFLKNSNLNIITLVNKYVYSSGVIAVKDFKKLNSIFIGTGIGATFNHFGDNTTITGNIDGEEYRIPISHKYFYLDDNNELDAAITKEELKSLNKDKLKLQVFEPDIYIEENIDTIKENRDLYLEELNNYIKSKQKHK